MSSRVGRVWFWSGWDYNFYLFFEFRVFFEFCGVVGKRYGFVEGVEEWWCLFGFSYSRWVYCCVLCYALAECGSFDG